MAYLVKKPEIDHHVLKFIVGVIALGLPLLLRCLAGKPLESLSYSYRVEEWPRNIFVGALCVIAAFLLAYNGKSARELLLSKVAAISAVFIAMFPCHCKKYTEIIPSVHGVASIVMFLVLAWLCWIFYKRAHDKHRREAEWRGYIYLACGTIMLGAIMVMGFDTAFGGKLEKKYDQFLFIGESAALMAFGLAWLVASRAIPFITADDERIRLLPEWTKEEQVK